MSSGDTEKSIHTASLSDSGILVHPSQVKGALSQDGHPCQFESAAEGALRQAGSPFFEHLERSRARSVIILENVFEMSNRITNLEAEKQELASIAAMGLVSKQILQKDKRDVQSSEGKLHAANEALRGRVELIEADRKLLRSSEEQLEAANESLRREVDDMTKRIASLEAEKKELESSVETMQVANESLRKNEEQLLAASESLRIEADGFAKLITGLEADKTHFDSLQGSLQKDKKVLQSRVDMMQAEKKLLRSSEEQLKVAKKSLQSFGEELVNQMLLSCFAFVVPLIRTEKAATDFSATWPIGR